MTEPSPSTRSSERRHETAVTPIGVFAELGKMLHPTDDFSMNQVLQRIGTKMMNVLEAYATNNGYSVVLDVSQGNSHVLWAAATSNITKPVVDAYNAQSGVAAPPRPAGAPAAGGAPAKPAAKPPATPPAIARPPHRPARKTPVTPATVVSRR